MASDDDASDDDDVPPRPVGAAASPPNLATPRFQPKAVNVGGDSLVDRVLPHLKKLIVVIAVVTVILVVVFGRRWWVERGMTSETQKIAVVLAAGAQGVRGSGDAPDPKNPTYADTAERANAVLTAIAKEGTDPGPLYRAGILVDAGKLDEAIAEYTKAESDKGLEGVLAREGKGLALEAKAAADKDPAASQKGYEAALAEFQAMQPEETGPRYAYAEYHQARMLILIGKPADAKAALLKAKDAAKRSTDLLPELIEKRLASLGA
jgi:hypothetical protein